MIACAAVALTNVIVRVVIVHLHHCKVLLAHSSDWVGYTIRVYKFL